MKDEHNLDLQKVAQRPPRLRSPREQTGGRGHERHWEALVPSLWWSVLEVWRLARGGPAGHSVPRNTYDPLHCIT